MTAPPDRSPGTISDSADVHSVRWPDDAQQAREVQEHLRSRLRIVPYRGVPRLIAGVDAAFTESKVAAAACLYSLPGLICREQSVAIEELRFPYVPGLLAFREGPAIIAALRKLSRMPDIVLVDGQGIAHPRRFGIACHIGVLLDMPAIGCAKTRLVGTHREPGMQKGARSDLRYDGGIVGAVLRTRTEVRPLYISPGHLIDIDGAVRIVMACAGKYRIPEPLRCADAASRNAVTQAEVATMICIDYTPFYYASVAGTTAPPVVSGKFIQIRNENDLYLILSPKDLTKYHANIAERFCMDRGIEGGYDARRERFIIRDQAWEILGGGKFERDGNTKAIKLYDNSMAYGKFDATGLKEALAALPEFTGYNILVE